MLPILPDELQNFEIRHFTVFCSVNHNTSFCISIKSKQTIHHQISFLFLTESTQTAETAIFHISAPISLSLYSILPIKMKIKSNNHDRIIFGAKIRKAVNFFFFCSRFSCLLMRMSFWINDIITNGQFIIVHHAFKLIITIITFIHPNRFTWTFALVYTLNGTHGRQPKHFIFHLTISFHFILLINKSPVNLLFYIFHNGNICNAIFEYLDVCMCVFFCSLDGFKMVEQSLKCQPS